MRFGSLLCVAGSLVCASSLARAATFNIANGDVSALKFAINTSNTNNSFDIINLAVNGVYTLTTVDNTTNGANGLPLIANDVFLGTDLVIHGNGATIQRSTAAGTPAFRILQFVGGVTCDIDNVIFANGGGLVVKGGAVYNNASRVTFANCTFNNNIATGPVGVNGAPSGGEGQGGAIYSSGPVMSVTSCDFNGNRVVGGNGIFIPPGGSGGSGRGAAIYSANATLSAVNCLFRNGVALGGMGDGHGAPDGYGYGGGIYCSGGGISTSTFFNNSAACGGGFYLAAGAATVSASALTDNNAQSGGAIFNTSTLSCDKTVISRNIVSSSGGGITSQGFNASLTVTSSTLSSNAASDPGGGGIANIYGALTVNNTTFSGNSAGYGAGGGVLDSSGTSTLTNCTFSGNRAGLLNFGDGGGAVCHEYDGTMTLANDIFNSAPFSNENIIRFGSGTILSQGSNLSNDAAGGDGSTAPGGFLNAAGDRRNTNPQLSPLANNGGPTQTHALLPGSPAIDAGNDGLAPHRDQRGYFRTGRSDIGAFEYQGGFLGAISLARNGTDAIISIEVVKGHTYRLQRKANITDRTWQSLFPAVADLVAVGDDTEPITDPNAISFLGKAFYHVIVLP